MVPRLYSVTIMDVQVANPEDIPAIMPIERVDGYERLVGRWDAEQHAREMATPSSRYMVARDGSGIIAFAILQRLDSPNRCIRLKRIAVRQVERGIGSTFLRLILNTCFDELAAHRVELFVHMENERARRAYERAGFMVEGVLRDFHRDADGTFRSMRLMSLLRPDWAAQSQRG